jgi:hypothetical protein
MNGSCGSWFFSCLKRICNANITSRLLFVQQKYGLNERYLVFPFILKKNQKPFYTWSGQFYAHGVYWGQHLYISNAWCPTSLLEGGINFYILKCVPYKTSWTKFCFPYISSSGDRIFKILVSIPQNKEDIMGGRHTIFEDPITWTQDMRKTKFELWGFLRYTLYLVNFGTP